MNEIVVLGGGFAGVEAAIKMRKYGYNVTLVSNRNYLFIYPISIWIPTGKKKYDDVKLDLNQVAKKHGFNVILDMVEKIEPTTNEVILSKTKLGYDYLIVALGMNHIKAKGIEHTHSICGHPEESLVIKKELEKIVAKGEGNIAVGFGGNPKDPTATEVRGGPAFELLFNISHFLKKNKLQHKVELTFFAPMKEPGKRMGKKPFKQMDVFFKHYKVQKQVGDKISEFQSDGIVFENGNKLKSDLTIYIPAGDGHKVINNSPDLPTTDAGFIRINELCRVQGNRNVYAVGDIAAITGPKWAAKQGHIAEVMAATAAFNIHNEIIQKGKRKSYWEHLNIVCVMDSGDGAAFIKRTKDTEFILPLPIIGHWMKKAWGFYYKNSKLKRIPRIPGM